MHTRYFSTVEIGTYDARTTVVVHTIYNYVYVFKIGTYVYL